MDAIVGIELVKAVLASKTVEPVDVLALLLGAIRTKLPLADDKHEQALQACLQVLFHSFIFLVSKTHSQISDRQELAALFAN
jgi:hypothetical protein